MAYNKQTWANTAGGGTPLNATRLNHMEDGIDQAYKGQYLIDAATPYDPGLGSDEFIVYRDGATPSTGKVTLDAIKAYMLANGLSSLTLEQVQDSVSGMLVAGTAITLTYNDGANTLTIDAATPPTNEQVQDLVAAMFVEGTDIDITYNDGAGTITITSLASGGGSLPAGGSTGEVLTKQSNADGDADWEPSAGGSSDPYNLLSDPGALAADEFDDASVDAAWVLTQPGSGTITASEGNHKLALSCTTATSDAGLFVRPLSSFGGAWSDGVTIVEAAWTSSRGITGIARANFCVTDGTSLTSNAVQINVSNGGGSSGTTLIYTFLGTANAPFGGGYVDCGHWFDDVRGRIVSLGAGSVGLQLSVNGDTWRTLGSAVSIGFTPTHVGFLVASGAGFAAFSSDYVRRIA